MGRYSLGGGGDAAVTALNSATDNELVTVGSTTTELDAETALTFDGSDLKLLEAVNNGNPTISLGGADAERLVITTTFDSGAQTLDTVEFATAAASGTADKGKMIFDVDGTDILTIDDGGLVIKTTGTIGPVGDEDLLTLTASGSLVTVAGELSVTTLDIGGTNVTSTAAEINTLDGLDRGSILYGNASSVTTVLGQGSANQVLTSDGTDIAWADVAAGGDISLAAENLTEATTSATSVTVLMTVGTDVNCDNDKMGLLTFLWRHNKDADASGSQNASYTYISMDMYNEGTLNSDVLSAHRPDGDITSGDLCGFYQFWFNPASTSYGDHATSSSKGNPRFWGNYGMWQTDGTGTGGGMIIPASFTGNKSSWSNSIDKVVIKGAATNTDTLVGVDQALFYVWGG